MNKLLLLLVFTTSIVTIAFAQNDSLSKKRKRKLYVDSYVKATKLFRKEPDMALKYAKISLKNASKNNQKAACNRLLGLISQRLGAFNSSESYYFAALSLSSDSSKIISLKNDLIEINRRKKNYLKAYKLALLVKNYRERHSSSKLANTYNLIGKIFFDLSKNNSSLSDSSIYYLKRSISLRGKNDLKLLKYDYYTISFSFERVNVDSSKLYIRKILNLPNIGDYMTSKSLFRLGQLENDFGNPSQAVYFLNKSLRIPHKDKSLLLLTYQNLAESHLKLGQDVKSIQYYTKCDSIMELRRHAVDLLSLDDEANRMYNQAEKIAKSLGKINMANQFYLHRRKLEFEFHLVAERDSLTTVSMGVANRYYATDKVDKKSQETQEEEANTYDYVYVLALIVAFLFFIFLMNKKKNDPISLEICIKEVQKLSKSNFYHKQDVSFSRILHILEKGANKRFLTEAEGLLMPGQTFDEKEKIVIFLQEYSQPDIAKILGYSESAIKNISTSIKKKTAGAWKKITPTKHF